MSLETTLFSRAVLDEPEQCMVFLFLWGRYLVTQSSHGVLGLGRSAYENFLGFAKMRSAWNCLLHGQPVTLLLMLFLQALLACLYTYTYWDILVFRGKGITFWLWTVKFLKWDLRKSGLIVMMCQCRFITWGECNTLIGNVDNQEGYEYVRTEDTWGISVPSNQFCCRHKTALKN